MNIWDTRNRIVEETIKYLDSHQNSTQINELMNHFETIKLAPQRNFGVSRFGQFEKRAINVWKTIQNIDLSRDGEIRRQNDE